MAKQKEKIYRRRRPVRALLRFLGILALAAAVLFVVVFFWFQSFIVYTHDGIRLDIPFLRGILDEIPEDASPYPLTPPVEELPGLYDPEDEPPPTIGAFRTIFLSADGLPAFGWEQASYSFDLSAVLIAMNDDSGMLFWDTDVAFAHSFELAGENDPAPYLAQIDGYALRSALLYTFENPLLATRNPALALTYGFLDPADPAVRTYLTNLALDLVRLGFDEIVLTGFTPPLYYQSVATDAAVLVFFRELAVALRASGASLSILTQEADWEGAYFERIVPIIDRVYCILDPQTTPDSDSFTALYSLAETFLGQNMHHFIPGSPGTQPDEGNWLIIPQAADE